jgi:predicted GIY-YIG superfamily endonuclease
MNFSYVYILQTISGPEQFYVGLTENLQARLTKHNAAKAAAPSPFALGK